jgi:hypothetical protein
MHKNNYSVIHYQINNDKKLSQIRHSKVSSLEEIAKNAENVN